MKNKIIFVCLIMLSSMIVYSQVKENRMLIPVLKFKDANPVLQIEVTASETNGIDKVLEISFDTKGTTDLGDIENATLFSCGAKENYEIPKNREIFGKIHKPKSILKFSGEQKLEKGKNHFLLSYKLKDNANLLHFAGASLSYIRTNKGKLKIEKFNSFSLRIGVALRKHGDESVHTYRIPGLVTTNKGTLLAVYDIRREKGNDLQGDIDVGIQRSTDGGNTWSVMKAAMDMGEYGKLPQKFNGIGDAILLVDKNSNNIFIAGLWVHGVLDKNGKWIEGLTKDSSNWAHQWQGRGSQPGFDPKETAQFVYAKSTDDGLSWSEPNNITKMVKKKEWWLFAPAPGNGITMNNGTLVFPTQGRDNDGHPFSNITFSNDGGRTWKSSNFANNNTTESAVVELSDGSLMLNIRDNRNAKDTAKTNGRSIYVTSDLGETWSQHPTSHNALCEPVCMASLYKHEYISKGRKKNVLLFSNPDTKAGRFNITIKVSFDEGKTWPKKYQILLDSGRGNGYSSLTGIDDRNIGILYEGSQAALTFQKISLKELLKDYH